MMRRNFKETETAVEKAVLEISEKDKNWKWEVSILKSQVRLYWGYLDYMYEKGKRRFFTIKEGTKEQGNDNGNFIILANERGEYMTGRIIGDDNLCDGGFERCTASLVKALWSIVSNTY